MLWVGEFKFILFYFDCNIKGYFVVHNLCHFISKSWIFLVLVNFYL